MNLARVSAPGPVSAGLHSFDVAIPATATIVSIIGSAQRTQQGQSEPSAVWALPFASTSGPTNNVGISYIVDANQPKVRINVGQGVGSLSQIEFLVVYE